MMRAAPPASDVLPSEYPWLAIGAVRYRQSLLRRAPGIVCVIPVERLATGNIRRQVRARTPVTELRIGAILAIAPVRHRRIPVEPDIIDRIVRPQRIERKRDI